MSIELFTDAVDEKGFFDPRYTCDFDNSSPELRWTDPPEETAGFAVIAEDPDVGSGFAHWVVYNIPNSIRHLPAGIPAQEVLPNGIRQGVNGYGKLGYAGPCPPPRSATHRYIFRIYVLRELPELASRPTREQLLAALQPHVMATAEVMGRYHRFAQKAG
ncbi:MAG: YbhB/YbcL family Raf kinase inhibitor-like protein [Oligoflexia bacterium]|nr:YbhB/YbcL family Raf kinase inhibitor-like protein [Oligoflexia bacterium]